MSEAAYIVEGTPLLFPPKVKKRMKKMASQELFDTTPKVKNRKLNVLPPNPEISQEERAVGLGRFPSWLHRKLREEIVCGQRERF